MLLTYFWLLFTAALFADNRLNTGFQFLNTLYSPRLIGLGGSYPALYGDLPGALINPAGGAFIRDRRFSIIYADRLLDLKSGYAGLSLPLKGPGRLGAGILYFDHGSFEETDRFAAFTGRTFHARDLALFATLSRSLGGHAAGGISVKYAYSRIDRYAASAIALDLGLLSRLNIWNESTVGISLRNLGKSLGAYDRVREPLPTALSVGLSQVILPGLLTAHGGFNNLWNPRQGKLNNVYDFSFGMEMAASGPLTLRTGYNNNLHFNLDDPDAGRLGGFSAGFALNLGEYQFDYGYADYSDVGATHHFGLTFALGRAAKKTAARPAADLPDNEPLPTPEDVTLESGPESVNISWGSRKGISYNVYVKLEGKTDWVVINQAPVKKNFVSLEKPRYPGTYRFAVTAVRGNEESAFSGIVNLTID